MLRLSAEVRETQLLSFFFFNDTATTEIYTLSLHDALPISRPRAQAHHLHEFERRRPRVAPRRDRKSTRLNSSHPSISYAVFCLKKKKHSHNQVGLSNPLPLIRDNAEKSIELVVDKNCRIQQ